MKLIPKLRVSDFTHVIEIQDVENPIPQHIIEVAKENNLSERKILHLTIFGSFLGKDIQKFIDENDNKKEVIDIINEITEKSKWEVVLGDKYYLVRKEYPEYIDEKGNVEQRTSIVQLAELKGLSDFYTQFNSKTGLNLIPLYPHLTLYSTSTIPEKVDRGIGIYTQNDLETLKAKLL